MAKIIELPTHTDSRGSLTVLEKVLPFAIKRVYWMHDLNPACTRGQHRHKETYQALICLQGACEVQVKKHQQEENFIINKPNIVLLLEPQDWHELKNFQNNPCILLLASHDHDPNDYIKEPLV